MRKQLRLNLFITFSHVTMYKLEVICKSFIRPHIDHGDILYDQTFNSSFHEKLESIQHNAALAITGALRCSSRE